MSLFPSRARTTAMTLGSAPNTRVGRSRTTHRRVHIGGARARRREGLLDPDPERDRQRDLDHLRLLEQPYSTACAMTSSTTPNTCMVGSVTTRHRVHIGVHAPRAGRVQIEDRQRELDARGQPTASERRAFAAVVARLMWSSIAVAGFDLEKSRYRPFQAELVRGAGRRPHAELARCHLLRVEIDRGRRLRAR
jgi:hypothetical protein